jgi:aquaporin Z
LTGYECLSNCADDVLRAQDRRNRQSIPTPLRERPEGRPTAPPVKALPWQLFLSEMIGTAVLLLGGLSLVILAFGAGGPIAGLVPSVRLRQAVIGFLFGCVGLVVTLSPVGAVSGAHINPAMTLGFLLMGKLTPRPAIGYVVAQLSGAILGCLPLLAWGEMGRSISFGATVPGQGYSTLAVLLGEAATTFGLVASLCVFLATRELRRFTPFMIPFLYALMVPLEAAISGTSTNPARSLGPAVVAQNYAGWWIYWVGPVIGTVVAIFACSFLARRIEVAKVYYFDVDRGGVFKAMSEA